MFIPLDFKKLYKIKKKKAIPFNKKEKTEIEQLFLNMLVKVNKEVIKWAKKETPDFVIRDLCSGDIGNVSGRLCFEFDVEEGWNDLTRLRLDNIIGITGFTTPENCPFTKIQIIVNGTIKRCYVLEGLEGTYFVTDPIVINHLPLEIRAWSKRPARNVPLVFRGLVAEKRGRTINP